MREAIGLRFDLIIVIWVLALALMWTLVLATPNCPTFGGTDTHWPGMPHAAAGWIAAGEGR